MGYQTDFMGTFTLSRELTLSEFNTLNNFTEERHEGDGPGYYCQWIPTKDGKGLKWDGNEKFYNYVEWLEELVNRFFSPWGIVLGGHVHWDGEESGDHGVIQVKNNVVKSARDSISNELDEED